MSTEPEESASPIKTAYYEDFLFADGNIIISGTGVLHGESGPETHTKLFRVHKSVLCTHSQVLADMFELAGPHSDHVATDPELYPPGLPVVHLRDELGDVIRLMEVLYMPA